MKWLDKVLEIIDFLHQQWMRTYVPFRELKGLNTGEGFGFGFQLRALASVIAALLVVAFLFRYTNQYGSPSNLHEFASLITNLRDALLVIIVFSILCLGFYLTEPNEVLNVSRKTIVVSVLIIYLFAILNDVILGIIMFTLSTFYLLDGATILDKVVCSVFPNCGSDSDLPIGLLFQILYSCMLTSIPFMRAHQRARKYGVSRNYSLYTSSLRLVFYVFIFIFVAALIFVSLFMPFYILADK